jgi:hypothetical protein
LDEVLLVVLFVLSRRFFATLLVATAATVACVNSTLVRHGSKGVLTASQRNALLKRAQVWRQTDVASADMMAGPAIKGAFASGDTVTCDYVKENFSGHTPKFGCARTAEDDLKVRYGRDNGEVYAFVAATRLLWALGFGADAVYPVHVVCRGCPREIQGDTEPSQGETRFNIAAVERKFPGRDLESPSTGPGWAWPELDLVDEAAGGAPRAQRDALKLLAVMLQHTDSKPEQQRLVCLESDKHESKSELAECPQPFMMIHDVGEMFGRANLLNRGELGSVNLQRWASVPVWRDAAHCVGNLAPSQTGTLANPIITEDGRKFLADLLAQLSDRQIADMFLVARFGERVLPNGVGGSSIESWVDAFKKKREEIAAATCP